MSVLWHQSGVNAKGEPFVQLVKDGDVIAQMTVCEARDHATGMLQAAEAAETDACLLEWLRTEIGLVGNAAPTLLLKFRACRSRRMPQKAQTPTGAGEWVAPASALLDAFEQGCAGGAINPYPDGSQLSREWKRGRAIGAQG